MLECTTTSLSQYVESDESRRISSIFVKTRDQYAATFSVRMKFYSHWFEFVFQFICRCSDRMFFLKKFNAENKTLQQEYVLKNPSFQGHVYDWNSFLDMTNAWTLSCKWKDHYVDSVSHRAIDWKNSVSFYSVRRNSSSKKSSPTCRTIDSSITRQESRR